MAHVYFSRMILKLGCKERKRLEYQIISDQEVGGTPFDNANASQKHPILSGSEWTEWPLEVSENHVGSKGPAQLRQEESADDTIASTAHEIRRPRGTFARHGLNIATEMVGTRKDIIYIIVIPTLASVSATLLTSWPSR